MSQQIHERMSERMNEAYVNEWVHVVCRTEDLSPRCTHVELERSRTTYPSNCVFRRRCMRYVRLHRPPVVLFENVPTVATQFKEEVLDPLIQMLERDGAPQQARVCVSLCLVHQEIEGYTINPGRSHGR